MSIIKDFIYSYIIGDSFGLSLLNNSYNKIKLLDNKVLNIEKGSISSMSTFMLCTMESIGTNKNIVPIDILNKMCTSLIVGKYTTNGKVYDLDNNTLNILTYYSKKNNLNIEYNELDYSSYALSRIVPLILFNYYNEDDLDKLVSLISITNVNEEVLFGSYIYYKYVLNLLKGKDKYKALKMEIPKGFSNEVKNKYKNILKGNIFYSEIEFNNEIINVISIIFYVILNSDNFNDIFNMISNIDGNTNIYSSLICGIGGILYGKDKIDKCIIKDIKNKKDINKWIKDFERKIL